MTLICEDPYDVDETTFALPDVRVWSEDDGLVPRPPQGWFIAFTLFPVEHRTSLIAAIWVELLLAAQFRSREAGFRRYRIARNANGDPVLLVHPDFTNWLGDNIEALDGMIQGGCNCGGWDCVEPVKNFQEKFNLVMAARKWPTLTYDDRKHALDEADDLPDHVHAAAIVAPTFPREILGAEADGVAFYVVHHL